VPTGNKNANWPLKKGSRKHPFHHFHSFLCSPRPISSPFPLPFITLCQCQLPLTHIFFTPGTIHSFIAKFPAFVGFKNVFRRPMYFYFSVGQWTTPSGQLGLGRAKGIFRLWRMEREMGRLCPQHSFSLGFGQFQFPASKQPSQLNGQNSSILQNGRRTQNQAKMR
jgi:hypothetical protein